ncbi:MAG: hypothetical protein J7493_17095 [Porphyrobacter sp.]|nr:hypothetical protein [Porphyrobacter sp.]
MRLFLIVAAVALAASSGANAQRTAWRNSTPYTGQWIADICGSEQVEDTLACYSFLKGLIDGLSLSQAVFDNQSLICPPDNVTLEQERRVVAKYGRDNPGELHLMAAMLVVNAIQTTWPCEAKRD